MVSTLCDPRAELVRQTIRIVEDRIQIAAKFGAEVGQLWRLVRGAVHELLDLLDRRCPPFQGAPGLLLLLAFGEHIPPDAKFPCVACFIQADIDREKLMQKARQTFGAA